MDALCQETFAVKSGVQFADTIYDIAGVVHIETDTFHILCNTLLMDNIARERLAIRASSFGSIVTSYGETTLSFVEDSFIASDGYSAPGFVTRDLIAAISDALASDAPFGKLTDRFYISDSSLSGSLTIVREFFGVSSHIQDSVQELPQYPVITEEFYAISRYVDTLAVRVREQLSILDSVFVDYSLLSHAFDSFAVSSKPIVAVSSSTRDIFGASASAFIIPNAAFTREVVGARSRVFGESFVSFVLIERAGIRSKVSASVREVTRESFKVADSVYIRLDSRATIRDRFGISSTALPDLSNNVFYRDRFGISVSAFVESSALKVVSDLFAATSRAMPERNDPLSAWTTDLRSWGMSRYLNLPVREFVGVQYGFGPGGVYTGRGTVSAGRIETGYILDRNAEAQAPVRQEKHLNYVYVYGASLGKLLLSVRAENAFGQQQVFSYQSPRFSQTPSAVRIPTGRGIRSTWMSFSITGAPFRIEYIEAQYTPTRRRV